MKFSIYGAGSWGTAMAIHIDRSGHEVLLIPRREEHTKAIADNLENKDYLPGLKLSKNIKVTSDIVEGLKFGEVNFLACPSYGLRELCENIKKNKTHTFSTKAYITLCKGLERGTNLPPVSVVKKVLTHEVCGMLSGPNYAGEIALGKPAASTLAMAEINDVTLEIQEALSNDLLRIYTSHDLAGVEYAGCLKNIYAIGAGICDGFKLGDNTKATYLTRSLYELVKIGTYLGGHSGTFYGLSGFGDLVATCFGAWSRNRTFGQKIAEGSSPKDIIQHQKSVVEGYWATDCFYKLLEQKHIDAPILSQIHKILYENKNPKQAVLDLMTRQLKGEI